MAWSRANGEDPDQARQTTMLRAAATPARPASWSATSAASTFKRFGFVQGAVVSRWAEIVGERYAKVSTPESIRFPDRARSRAAR